jgi:hypothetical protein
VTMVAASQREKSTTAPQRSVQRRTVPKLCIQARVRSTTHRSPSGTGPPVGWCTMCPMNPCVATVDRVRRLPPSRATGSAAGRWPGPPGSGPAGEGHGHWPGSRRDGAAPRSRR